MFPFLISRNAVVCAGAACIMLGGATAALRAGPAEDREAVEAFLQRLGLVDLQILSLEQAVEKQAPGAARQKQARRLADLYAARLLSVADDKARYEELLVRIRKLVKLAPEANSTALQVMLLQADYNRAEAQIGKWIDEKSDAEALREANQILDRIASELVRHRKELNEAIDKLTGELDNLKGEDEKAAKEQELRGLNSVTAQATYLAGWSSYYAGLAKADRAAGKPSFSAARVIFRELLGLSDDDLYEKVEVESLGLELEGRARTLIGLGLTEAALDNLPGSRECFRLLDHVNTAPKIRDEGTYWYLRGLLNSGKIREATAYATEQIERYAGNATAGKVSFCDALLRAAYAGGKPTAETKRLGELGIQGLARLRQFGALGELVARYKVSLEEAGGFYLTWIKGQQQFAAAEKSKAADDYEAAAKTLLAALDDPQAKTDVASAGACRNLLASCHYHLGRFEEAAQQYQQAAGALQQSGGNAAVEAAWNGFVSYQKLYTKEPRFVAAAIEALELVERDFPGTPQAQKAGLYVAKLKQAAASPEESIAAYSKIKPADPTYLTARFELCKLHHQAWAKVKGDKLKAPPAAHAVKQAVDKFLTDARQDKDGERKLRAMLLAVSVALGSTPPDEQAAEAQLEKSKPLVAALPPTSSAVAEYHYSRLRLAQQASDSAEQLAHAAWLEQHAAGSTFESAALVTLAKQADEQYLASGLDKRAERRERALKVYTRLVQLLGDSAETLAAKKNAVVASLKLAEYEFDAERFESAATRLERLVAAYPKEKEYLRRAGLAQFSAGRFDAALVHFRTVLSGVAAGSDDWYEAKYYQLLALAKTDRAEAKAVYEQFKLLAPEIKSAAWRDKFAALATSLGA